MSSLCCNPPRIIISHQENAARAAQIIAKREHVCQQQALEIFHGRLRGQIAYGKMYCIG